MGLVATCFSASAGRLQCEISGMNLMQAYSRAVNNNIKVGCSVNKKPFKDNHYILMPTPGGLICKHSKHLDPLPISRGFSAYYFRPNLKNGWRITRASSTGGAKKSISRYGVTLTHSNKKHSESFSSKLTKIWIQNNDTRFNNCNNMQSIIRNAFGD